MASEIVTRRIESLLGVLAADEPVIALHGPRSVGKSTVLNRYATAHGAPVVSLDDPGVRDAARANPTSVVAGDPPICIDEYQRAPVLLDALKDRLNRGGATPGLAVLTGSTRQDALPRTAQALTGRIHSTVILPLSQGEIDGWHEDLLERLRVAPERAVAAHPTSETTRAEYVERITRGGFPIAIARSTRAARMRWFDDYVATSLSRDASDVSRVRDRQILADVFQRIAATTGQVLNATRISGQLELTRKSIEQPIRLLEDLFLVERLPAWGRTLTARSTGKPKVHVVDSGLAAHLMRVNAATLATLDPAVLSDLGHLVETFVVGELRKQVSWMEEPATIGHWRTSDGDEVDLVVEFADGGVLAFEVKTAERVAGKDLGGLRSIRRALGGRFIGGVAFSMGSRSYTYEDRIHVMPIDRLWRTVGDV